MASSRPDDAGHGEAGRAGEQYEQQRAHRRSPAEALPASRRDAAEWDKGGETK